MAKHQEDYDNKGSRSLKKLARSPEVNGGRTTVNITAPDDVNKQKSNSGTKKRQLKKNGKRMKGRDPSNPDQTSNHSQSVATESMTKSSSYRSNRQSISNRYQEPKRLLVLSRNNQEEIDSINDADRDYLLLSSKSKSSRSLRVPTLEKKSSSGTTSTDKSSSKGKIKNRNKMLSRGNSSPKLCPSTPSYRPREVDRPITASEKYDANPYYPDEPPPLTPASEPDVPSVLYTKPKKRGNRKIKYQRPADYDYDINENYAANDGLQRRRDRGRRSSSTMSVAASEVTDVTLPPELQLSTEDGPFARMEQLEKSLNTDNMRPNVPRRRGSFSDKKYGVLDPSEHKMKTPPKSDTINGRPRLKFRGSSMRDVRVHQKQQDTMRRGKSLRDMSTIASSEEDNTSMPSLSTIPPLMPLEETFRVVVHVKDAPNNPMLKSPTPVTKQRPCSPIKEVDVAPTPRLSRQTLDKRGTSMRNIQSNIPKAKLEPRRGESMRNLITDCQGYDQNLGFKDYEHYEKEKQTTKVVDDQSSGVDTHDESIPLCLPSNFPGLYSPVPSPKPKLGRTIKNWRSQSLRNITDTGDAKRTKSMRRGLSLRNLPSEQRGNISSSSGRRAQSMRNIIVEEDRDDDDDDDFFLTPFPIDTKREEQPKREVSSAKSALEKRLQRRAQSMRHLGSDEDVLDSSRRRQSQRAQSMRDVMSNSAGNAPKPTATRRSKSPPEKSVAKPMRLRVVTPTHSWDNDNSLGMYPAKQSTSSRSTRSQIKGRSNHSTRTSSRSSARKVSRSPSYRTTKMPNQDNDTRKASSRSPPHLRSQSPVGGALLIPRRAQSLRNIPCNTAYY